MAASSERQSNDWMVARRAEPGLADRLHGQAGEGIGVRALRRLVGRQLGLDIEAHGLAGLLDQLEQLGQRREALPVRRLLVGELPARTCSTGSRRPMSKRLSSAKVKLLMAGPGADSHLPSGPRTMSGLSSGIVREHEYAVAGDGEVGLERRDADLERLGEGGQRILRRQAARAPVALQIEGTAGAAAVIETTRASAIIGRIRASCMNATASPIVVGAPA